MRIENQELRKKLDAIEEKKKFKQAKKLLNKVKEKINVTKENINRAKFETNYYYNVLEKFEAHILQPK